MRSLTLRARDVVCLPVLLFYGDLYLSLRGYKRIASYMLCVRAAVAVLFKQLERVLFEFGFGGCNLCKYKLAAGS